MIFLTDLHLDTFRQWSTLENGINTRLLDQIKVIAEVGRAIERSNTQNVIFLGDLINSFSDSLPKVVYNAIWYAIRTWSTSANLYVIAGNHDIYRQMHIFDPYREVENVHIVTEPMRAEIEGYKVDMVPWGFEVPIDRGDILAAHLAVYGARMSAQGIRSTEGVTTNDLIGYKYIFLGHFHEAQKFAVPGALWAGYIGAIMQTDITLSPKEKGITLLEKGDVGAIQIPSPRIYAVRVDTQDDADDIVGHLTDGSYWRLTITDPAIKLPGLDHRVQVEYDIKPKTEARLEEKPGEDLKETVRRFIATVETKGDKAMALQLVDEVMQ